MIPGFEIAESLERVSRLGRPTICRMDSGWHAALLNAARASLLDDAALGREHKAAMVALGNEIEALRAELERRREDAELGERVRAAAGDEANEAVMVMGRAMAELEDERLNNLHLMHAQAAARALVAMKEGAK